MAVKARPGEQYTIRRKILKIFGAAFHVYDPNGGLVAYCKQKAFKLKEDIRLYTSEACSEELLVMKARSIIDFGATYDITLPTGEVLASLRRKGLKSTFLKDEWLVFDHEGRQVAVLRERGRFLSFMRRYTDYGSLLAPQKFDMHLNDGTPIAMYRQHFNWFVYRLGVSILKHDEHIDDLAILAAGCLICAIEGRQR
ncbi:MAG: hypothetical protein KF866_08310 [Phycisphaeraceae bacterium]|nr:hypothetical protein [Phycisphaeraceae bacterium]MCW5753879.1 hypothetical protein [Phycisphaeraceae bacterium]